MMKEVIPMQHPLDIMQASLPLSLKSTRISFFRTLQRSLAFTSRRQLELGKLKAQ